MLPSWHRREQLLTMRRIPALPLPVQIIGAGVGGMPYALKEAGFYR